MSGLRWDGVTAGYGDLVAVADVTAAVAPGQVLGVVGPNGAGKSTLLKVAVGLVPLRGGQVTLDGGRVLARPARVAYLAQRAAIDWTFPAQVRDVVAFGRYPHRGALRRWRTEDRTAVEGAIAKVGLAGLRSRQIGRLSGGQQQRLLLARALAQEPDVLLLDEPFTAVDPATTTDLVRLLRALAADGAAVVVVSHDLAGVTDLSDEVLLLSRTVVAAGPAAAVLRPDVVASAYAAAPPPVERA